MRVLYYLFSNEYSILTTNNMKIIEPTIDLYHLKRIAEFLY
ncbi:hypothetical protein A28LD_1661 [Idiomarina sp. A28L]|nr:hypothetical protein A28LD_1661 [Idiomarina sp. A28L]